MYVCSPLPLRNFLDETMYGHVDISQVKLKRIYYVHVVSVAYWGFYI